MTANTTPGMAATRSAQQFELLKQKKQKRIDIAHKTPRTLLKSVAADELLCVRSKSSEASSDYSCHYFTKSDTNELITFFTTYPEELRGADAWVISPELRDELEAVPADTQV